MVRRGPNFSHPDFHRRLRNYTGSCPLEGSRAVTAGGELHPAPKLVRPTVHAVATRQW